MAKIGTKNVGGDGISKTLIPGNHTGTILSVKLEVSKFKAGSYNLMFTVKGPKLENFEGFSIDKDDDTKGHYDGQIGFIRATEWAFADGTTKGGTPISMDDEILKFIKKTCVELNAEEWFKAQDDVHDTIEDFVNAFDKDQPFAGKTLDFCIAGREYVSKKGYTNYDLFFPKFTRIEAPFQLSGSKPSKLISFDKDLHIKKSVAKEVAEFGDTTAEPELPETDDFKV